MDLQVHPKPEKGSGNSVAVSDQVFDRPFNEDLVHQVITAYLAAGRQGTKAQKTRAEASGGGAKPWRQKGTGRARAGSIRSPLWRGGGKTFAARPRDFSQKVNRKMYRSAMRSIVSELVRQERLMPIDGFGLGDVPRTQQLLERLQTLGVGTGRTLIVDEPISDVLALSARNLPNVFVAPATTVDPVSLIGADRVLITADALKRLEERLE